MARVAGQLTLESVRRPMGRGGWRPGAGRPRGRTTASHARREGFAASVPQHVTLRIVRGVPMRREKAVRVVRSVIAAVGRGDEFRVVEFAVMSNHVHLLVEAEGERALARGMQRLAIRLALGVNAVLGRKGALVGERYHARALKTPREVRVALRYVLLNARKHAAEAGVALARDWIDPCSSGAWFAGWREGVRADAWWLEALVREGCPVARARTWLLAIGWRRWGLIGVDEVAGCGSGARAVGRGRV